MTFPESVSSPKRGLRVASLAGKGEEQLGQAEVDDLWAAILGDYEISWLEVPVDHAFAVRLGQSFCHLDGDLERPADVKRTPPEDVPQLLPSISSIAMNVSPSTSSTSWITAMWGVSGKRLPGPPGRSGVSARGRRPSPAGGP